MAQLLFKRYCLKDHYWAHIYSEIVKGTKTFTSPHNRREVLVLKERIREILAPLDDVTTEDILAAIVETGLSGDVVKDIMKELHKTKTHQHSKNSFAKVAAVVEKEVLQLGKKVQYIDKQIVELRNLIETVRKEANKQQQDNLSAYLAAVIGASERISIIEKVLKTHETTINTIQQQLAAKFNQLEESLPDIINQHRDSQIDEVSSRLAALEQAYEKVSGVLNEVEAVKEVVREKIGEGNGQVLVRLSALEQGFREVTRLFGDVRKITEAITDIRKTLNQYTADRVTLARFFWQQVEMWRELHKVWSKNGTSSDRPAIRCLSVHKDDTSPFHNAGMI
jgi:hypothetical protein